MPTTLRHVVSLLLVVIVCSFAVEASALTDEEKEAIKAAVKEGSEAYSEGRFLDAVEAFERAEKISENTRVQYNLARALEEAGHCKKAMKLYESLVANKETEKLVLEKAKEKVDEGTSCTPRGNIMFACETPGAVVTLNGAAATCGETIRLEAAELPWTASAPGHIATESTVTVVEAETVSVIVALQPVPQATSGPNWKLFTGLGLLGAGIGAVAVGVVSDSTATTRSEQIVDASADGDRDRLAKLQDGAQSARTQTLVLYSVGGALATGGIILLVLDMTEDSEPVALSPVVHGDGAGVEARWRW